MSEPLAALHESATRLHRMVEGFDPQQLRQSAYPTEWTIADVLSHIGSGAVILGRRLDDIVNGLETDPASSQSTWDEWNAKPPEAQAADALAADTALLNSLDAVGDEQRANFQFAMGPFNLDFVGLVMLRLNEHVLHTWDIEVVGDPATVLPDGATRVVIDGLGMVARFAGRPSGSERVVRVRTTEPDRGFTLTLGTDSFEMTPSEPDTQADFELPAEAFIRLVYGRLDPDHAPRVANDAVLDELRKAFPGF
jgi:uncharacterized protein (TIGR03083 family)